MSKTLVTIFAGALLVLSVIVWSLNRQHSQLTTAQGEAERLRLKADGQIVAVPEDTHDLDTKLAELISENSGLREALAKAKLAAPGAKAVAVAVLETAPSPVIPISRVPEQEPAPLPPCASNSYAPDGTGGFYCLEAGKAPPPTCLLTSADTGSFRVSEVVLRAQAESKLLTGTAEYWRETPSRAKLAQEVFSSTLSEVETLQPPDAPRWGALALGLCTAAGCGAGLGAAFPPLRVLGLTAEPFLAVFSGGAGTGALGGLAVRF